VVGLVEHIEGPRYHGIVRRLPIPVLSVRHAELRLEARRLGMGGRVSARSARGRAAVFADAMHALLVSGVVTLAGPDHGFAPGYHEATDTVLAVSGLAEGYAAVYGRGGR
jgi:hypothetical protein